MLMSAQSGWTAGQQGRSQRKATQDMHVSNSNASNHLGVPRLAPTLDVCLALPYGTRLNSMYWERLLRSSGPSTLVLNCAH